MPLEREWKMFGNFFWEARIDQCVSPIDLPVAID